LVVYGRFLSTRIVIANPIAIAIIMATTPPTMYISVGGKTVTGYGDAVGAAALRVKADSVLDEP
jgi:hypothetical protein